MVEVVVSDEFERRYSRLSPALKTKAEKQERLFRSNPFHPSLHTEKLEPRGKQVWSFRIDKSYRVAFRFIAGTKVLFLTVGPHDWVYRFRF